MCSLKNNQRFARRLTLQFHVALLGLPVSSRNYDAYDIAVPRIIADVDFTAP
jgi:hypothetical protein